MAVVNQLVEKFVCGNSKCNKGSGIKPCSSFMKRAGIPLHRHMTSYFVVSILSSNQYLLLYINALISKGVGEYLLNENIFLIHARNI